MQTPTMGTHPQALLIDLDGTMVDSAPDLCAAATLMLADLGRTALPLATVASFIGDGVPMLVARVLVAAGLAGSVDPAAAVTSFARHYSRTNGRHGSACPGASYGVAALRRAGYRLACVTNKPQVFADTLLRMHRLHHHFDLIQGGDTAAGLKPSAAPLLQACAQLGVAPHSALMIGDSSIDVAAAHAAGMPAWLVRTGYPGAAALAGADAVFDQLDQLAAHLGRRTAAPSPPSHPSHPHAKGIEQ